MHNLPAKCADEVLFERGLRLVRQYLVWGFGETFCVMSAVILGVVPFGSLPGRKAKSGYFGLFGFAFLFVRTLGVQGAAFITPKVVALAPFFGAPDNRRSIETASRDAKKREKPSAATSDRRSRDGGEATLAPLARSVVIWVGLMGGF